MYYVLKLCYHKSTVNMLTLKYVLGWKLPHSSSLIFIRFSSSLCGWMWLLSWRVIGHKPFFSTALSVLFPFRQWLRLVFLFAILILDDQYSVFLIIYFVWVLVVSCVVSIEYYRWQLPRQLKSMQWVQQINTSCFSFSV